MKFTTLLKNLIIEQTGYQVKFDKNTKPQKDKEGNVIKPLMSKNEFNTLVQADPTTRLNNVDIDTASKEDLGKIKAGNYVDWLVKQYLNVPTERKPDEQGYVRELMMMRERFFEDLYKVTEDLKKFDRFKKRLPLEKRDINKLNVNSLYDAVKDFDLTLATTTKSERKQAEVHPGAKMIYDSPNLRVIEISDKGPAGKEAACFYGGNQQETRWCTSAPGLSHFDYYINKGPLYVIFDPSDTNVSPKTGLPVERWQLNFETDQYMDRHDHQISLIEKLNGPWKELKELFKPKFAKGLTVGGTSLSIDNFERGNVGKFVALYGLDELIANLPDTLEEFQIINRERNKDIIIQIPDTISRFKNLSMILLENCIDRIPDSICKLPNLNFISLVSNPKLTTIPECIADIPSLMFLNLQGSNNVEVPEKIKEKSSTALQDGFYDFQK